MVVQNLNIRILTIFVALLFGCVLSEADILQIPLSCWPVEIQEKFTKRGYKLDLSPIGRTDKSWGYIISYGSNFDLYTYRPVTPEDFRLVQEIVFEVELEKRKLQQEE